METKEYYTPSIEDFYLGYEYEKCDIVGEWYKCKAQLYDLSDIQTLKTQTDLYNKFGKEGFEAMFEKQKKDKKDFLPWSERIRVPYLCKQDIIDLGWKHKQYVKDGELVYNFVKGEWYLEYWVGKIPYVEIGREEYDMGYAGNCKSKNELFKLMKDYLNIHI